MNSNEIYLSYAKQLNIKFENIKAKIKNNEIERLGLMITELRDLRKEYITAFQKIHIFNIDIKVKYYHHLAVIV